MAIHQRRLKVIELTLGDPPVSYECALTSWTLTNNTDDGDKIYTYCPDGEDQEEVEPDWALDLTFYADWRENGISDYLTANDGQNAAFVLDHHPDIPEEHVRWTGTVRIKAPNVGGDARTTEQTSQTLQIIGVPVYSRPDES